MKTRECKGRVEVLAQGTTLHRRRGWTYVAVSTYIEKSRWYLPMVDFTTGFIAHPSNPAQGRKTYLRDTYH